MNDTDLCYLSGVELRRLYERRELSPVEVTEAVLRRIESLDPRINAFVTVTPERALAEARVAEAAFAGDEEPPPLGWHTRLTEGPDGDAWDPHHPGVAADRRLDPGL